MGILNKWVDYIQVIESFYMDKSKILASMMALISELALYFNFLLPINFYNNLDWLILVFIMLLTVFRKNIGATILFIVLALPFFAINLTTGFSMLLVLIFMSFILETNISTYYILTIVSLTFAFFGTPYIVIPFTLFTVLFARNGRLFSIAYPLIIMVLLINSSFESDFIITMNTVTFTNLDQLQAILNDANGFQSNFVVGIEVIKISFLYGMSFLIVFKGIMMVVEEYFSKLKGISNVIFLMIAPIVGSIGIYVVDNFKNSSKINIPIQFVFMMIVMAVLSVIATYYMKSYIVDQEDLDKLRFKEVVKPEVKIAHKIKRTKDEEFEFLSPIGANLNSILSKLLNETVRIIAIKCFGEKNWFQEVQKIMNEHPDIFIDPTSVLSYEDMDATKASRLLTDTSFPLARAVNKYPGFNKSIQSCRQARNNIAHNNSVGQLEISYLYILLDSSDKLRANLYSYFPIDFSAEESKKYVCRIKDMAEQLKEF